LGIVYWEIVSRKKPRNIEELNNYYDWKEGIDIERETIPEDCPEGFKKTILECWKYKPENRPSADELISIIKDLGLEIKKNYILTDYYRDHYSLIIACEQLEKIIHPKRTESLYYISPFITNIKVEEPIEIYWNKWETENLNLNKSYPNLTQIHL